MRVSHYLRPAKGCNMKAVFCLFLNLAARLAGFAPNLVTGFIFMLKGIFLPIFRRPRYYFLPAAIFILSSFVLIKAQPDYSKSELRLIKKKGYAGNALKLHLPQNKFPMPEIPDQNRPQMTGGGIDSTFNAS